MTIEELYGRYIACGCRVTTDSRTISGGEIFFALRGENFDGNGFALQALGKGAALAVVNSDADLPATLYDCPSPISADDPRVIRVEDPFRTLQELAIWHRTHVRDGKLPVIGLTGTNGKTTTKNLIEAVLSRKYKVTATRGNLNNDIGVPLSLLGITPETEIAVIEMGANHPDDIAKLVQVSRPDYGLITNVGKAHLLGFGSFEGVKAAKGELYRWLGTHEGSLIFINEDDADLRGMAAGQPCHTYGYGINLQGASILPVSAGNPFLSLMLDGETIKTQLVGTYNANNVLAAICIGDYFGVPRKESIAAVEAFIPTNNRSQMTKTASNTLIVDAYNANPTSMLAALDNFAAIEAPVKVAMLGDMRELGAESVNEHARIVWKLSAESIDSYLVGEEFRKALEMFGISPDDSSNIKGIFASSDDLAAFLKENPVRDAVVLVKGSRGIRMEKIIPEL